MNVFIDIETIPDQRDGALDGFIKNVSAPGQYKKPESIAQWIADNAKAEGEAQWLKTSFDGARGQICCICYAIDGGDIKRFYTGDGVDETSLLWAFNKTLTEDLNLRGETMRPYFVGHYIKGFDLPFLFKRMVINQVQPEFKFTPFGRHGSDFYDTMEAWEGFKGSISLDNLSKALGFNAKHGVTGADVWPMFKDGKYEEIASYCADDVEAVRNVYNKLNFIK